MFGRPRPKKAVQFKVDIPETKSPTKAKPTYTYSMRFDSTTKTVPRSKSAKGNVRYLIVFTSQRINDLNIGTGVYEIMNENDIEYITVNDKQKKVRLPMSILPVNESCATSETDVRSLGMCKVISKKDLLNVLESIEVRGDPNTSLLKLKQQNLTQKSKIDDCKQKKKDVNYEQQIKDLQEKINRSKEYLNKLTSYLADIRNKQYDQKQCEAIMQKVKLEDDIILKDILNRVRINLPIS